VLKKNAPTAASRTQCLGSNSSRATISAADERSSYVREKERGGDVKKGGLFHPEDRECLLGSVRGGVLTNEGEGGGERKPRKNGEGVGGGEGGGGGVRGGGAGGGGG